MLKSKFIARIALLQSNYIPWKGYFHVIDSVDKFVLYDEVQYTKNDWRNRNRIKSATGVVQWLSIPVRVASLAQRICETDVACDVWKRKHWNSLRFSYAKAEGFSEFGPQIEEWYSKCPATALSEINRFFIEKVCQVLDIRTPILDSRDFCLEGDKQQRIISLCKALGADEYLSGPAARSYIDLKLFNDNGINVIWQDYSRYPSYPQCGDTFEHAVSILDVLFNVGSNARQFIKPVIE